MSDEQVITDPGGLIAEDSDFAVMGIGVEVRAVLGKNTMPVRNLLKLGRGAVVELDCTKNDTIGLFVNNRLVAGGTVTITKNQKLAISITYLAGGEKAAPDGA